MNYYIELKPTEIKDLKAISPKEVSRIIAQLALLEDDMKGNVKRLTNFTPEYRMRAGNYRAFFERACSAEGNVRIYNSETINA